MSRNFLCRCEDIDTDEVHEAIEDGFDDLESLRRYTAIGTGPCQGKACIQETIRLLADHHGVEEQEIGQMTLRPPFCPVPLGHLAALPREALEQLLGGEEGQQAQAARQALEDTRHPRTGRPTPESLEKERKRHQDQDNDQDRRGKNSDEQRRERER